jgi:hypothetical protein
LGEETGEVKKLKKKKKRAEEGERKKGIWGFTRSK